MMTKHGVPLVLIAAGLALGACSATNVVTTVAGGAVSVVGTAAGAAVSAGTTVAGAAGSVLGAAGSAATAALGGSAVATGAVTAPGPAAAPPPGPTAAPEATVTEATLTETTLPETGTSGGRAAASVELAVLAAGGGAAAVALTVHSALASAGADAVPTAQVLERTTRSGLDRCALQVFVGIASAVGEADAARVALWLNERARRVGEAEMMSGFGVVAEQIQNHLRRTTEQARVLLASATGLEAEDARRTFEAAGDIYARCPSATARQLTEIARDQPQQTL